LSFETIGIVGAGAWGTALAQGLGASGHPCLIWAHEPETVADINGNHRNTLFLPDVPLEATLRATSEIADLADRDLILLVPPAQHLGAISAALAASLPATTPVVVCAKGIERGSNRLLGDVLADTMPDQTVAYLSGPSFAADVSRGRPAALTVASQDAALGEAIALAVGSRILRLYWTDDVIGVQLGGAIKNVLAIAAGIVDGMQLGASAHAALVTRGFAEMRRFGEALGAQPATLSGLAGLGDLLLTCGSPTSRNMSLGRALGQGRDVASVMAERKSVTEGVYTAGAMVALADKHGIDVPIARAVFDIVENHTPISDVIDELMQRPMKSED
jgi:glycerol-3-phosphate dehydrogenase (NAD(P)+)